MVKQKEERIMKKSMLFLSAVLALVACNKETPVKDGAIDASQIVFNITVNRADNPVTKGIESGWKDDDIVYLFFEDQTSHYVKMTCTSASTDTWEYTVCGEGDMTLASENKKVTAVYFPSYVNSEEPTPGATFTFAGAKPGFVLYAAGEDYTLSTENEVTTLSANLEMEAPANLVQVYIPNTVVTSGPGSGNEYVLTVTNVKPFMVGAIAPGGDVTITEGTANFPLTPIETTIGSDAGYYFWGILANASAGEIDYTFQLVKQNAEKKYAISSMSKTVEDQTLTDPVAIKLSSLTDNGNFVSLGYADGPLWATGNLKETSPFIADPLEAGDYYKWGYTTPYDMTGTTDAYSNRKAVADFEDTATAKNTDWRIPTWDQFAALITNTNASTEYSTACWQTGWTNIGVTKGGALLKSTSNGISLFFAAADSYYMGVQEHQDPGHRGYYWSSTPYDYSDTYYLDFVSVKIFRNFDDNGYGIPVRPVQN